MTIEEKEQKMKALVKVKCLSTLRADEAVDRQLGWFADTFYGMVHEVLYGKNNIHPLDNTLIGSCAPFGDGLSWYNLFLPKDEEICTLLETEVEPVYRPFKDASEYFALCKGIQKIRKKNDSCLFKVCIMSVNTVTTMDDKFHCVHAGGFQYMYDNYVFENGTPFGAELAEGERKDD